ncbi:MAG: SDR family oxidoreductase [Thermodesulfobacteriota bacterium]
MSQKVALITGGARGIGKKIALTLARKDWNVAICYRTSQSDAEETVGIIKEIGTQGYSLKADVSDPEAAKGLVKDVEKKYGRIDALINCAGPYHRINILKETAQGWNAMFDNNLHPVFYLTQAVSEGMIERESGRIINFSMANADKMMAQTEVTAHYIAKAGVLMLTRAFARQLATHGITVNAISPGFIDSGSAPKDELNAMLSKIPAGYIGSPKDAVDAALYLLSEEASYVNGSNIILSGGWGL